ncbi:hypothetical protein SAMN05880590_112156 [Rhizobium sp. RU35A]|nr:hypothetical protein SAMN05880590_112156 [Rhizobium sp. RU35A]
MSGLETAIRNALARSDRGDADLRARIYQSARQALEAGLRKQEVTDDAVIDAERRRLEAKIREIEAEERARVPDDAPDLLAIMPSVGLSGRDDGGQARHPAAPETVEPAAPAPDSAVSTNHVPGAGAASAPSVSPPAPDVTATRSASAASAPAPSVSAVRRDAAPAAGMPPEASLDMAVSSPAASAPQAGEAVLGGLDGMRAERSAERPATHPLGKAGRPQKVSRGRKAKAASGGRAKDGLAPAVPGERRRRRRGGVLSSLFTLFTFLILAGIGLWWAANTGLLQALMLRETGLSGQVAQRSEQDGAGAPSHFDPQRGFSADWLEVFGPDRKAVATAGSAATVETVAMADGPALKITSAVPNANGEVAVEVPAAILRELAGKTSTMALTLQSVGDVSVQLAVRCDFPGIGDCSRHRVLATQERADTLFRVTFPGGVVPNQPGRIYLNSDILNGGTGVLVYSLRVLPGQ